MPQDDLQLQKQKCVDNLQMSAICEENSNLKTIQRTSESDKESSRSTDYKESFEKRHMPFHDKKRSASRCKLPKCKLLTHVYCEKCEKHLCFNKDRNCFVAHHETIKEF